MKVVRKIFSVLLSLILFDVVFLLVLSFSLKSVINDGLITKMISGAISSQITNTSSTNINSYNESNNEFGDIDTSSIDTGTFTNEQYNEIMNDFMDDYSSELINQIMSSLKDPENANEAEISNAIIDYIREHKSELESKYNVTISDEAIDEVASSEAMIDADKQFSSALQSSSNQISKSERELLKVYDYMTSNNFRIILGVISLVLLILIALLQGSFYMWMRTLGNILFISGIFNLISTAVMSLLVKSLIEELKIDMAISFSPLYKMSIILCVVGALLFIAYQVIKYVMKNKINEEVNNSDSAVSLDDDANKEE